jgi:hypothetical protein
MVLELLPQKWAAMFTHIRLSKEVSVVVGDGVIHKPRLRNGPYKGDRMNFFVILAGINHFVIIFRWCFTTYPTEEIKSHDCRVD